MGAITIDKDKAIELLEKQVEKKGADYVYPSGACEYFASHADMSNAQYDGRIEVEIGAPLCILGHVYADLGLGPEDLRMEIRGIDGDWEPTGEIRYEPTDNGALFGDDTVPDPEKVILTEDARLVFGTAQSEQDARSTWGEALESAKAAVKGEEWN